MLRIFCCPRTVCWADLDKTIKLWKVFEKSIKIVSENNLGDGGRNPSLKSTSQLKFPKMIHHDTITAAMPRKIYQNGHGYHIHSISVNSDGETYISADDLRINLWNLEISDQSFSTRGSCRYCGCQAR